MRIGWVTPLAQNSAIGRVSAIVCDELAARGHRVDIIRSESRETVDSPHWPTEHKVTTSFEVSFLEAEKNYDVVFLNVGDNFSFHGGIFEYLRRPTAIGIFHDFYLFNLFNGWRHSLKLSGPQSSREIVAAYGPGAADAALRAVGGAMDVSELASAVPMTEWVAMRCAGAIAHANFYVPRLRASCAGTVDVANLPWPGREVPPPAQGKDRLTVVTVGVVNPNKCVDVVIDAIGQSAALREKVRYVVAGPIDDATRSQLEGKAREQGVQFEALGSVSEDELLQVLGDADIMCCLRRPVLEGASASAIEGMLSGRPTIVADAGFYAELPSQHVVKVPEQVGAADLKNALERLASDPQARQRMGESARAFAAEAFSVSAYVDRLESVVRDQARLGPYLELGDRLAQRLSRLGMPPSSGAVDRLAAAIDGMRLSDRQSPHRI
ncbi:glycosyltransferase family 4 protein [Arvimicrobium flavum]|uniref:glycosyltransferase family 4 protein n=1 Tax=Arvimicrobium flavum TaxID=3393320 RepID=UPI00237C15DC|nr:glycosyltransferase family 4 protein [Mesorhizobium shangrilense]